MYASASNTFEKLKYDVLPRMVTTPVTVHGEGKRLWRDRLIDQIDATIAANLTIGQLFVLVNKDVNDTTSKVGDVYLESVAFMVSDSDAIKALIKAPA